MSEELKPCAHCGHTVEWVPTFEIEDDEGEFGCIRCLGCGIQTTKILTEEEAAEVWNTRQEPDDVNRMRNLLEDVVNALDLSEIAIETHGPLGTEPAELVKLVLDQKDMQIALLQRGFRDVTLRNPEVKE